MESKQLIETVTKARRGDTAALQELYLDMYKSVFYLALRIVKNPEDAEDITQEVYITVQQKIAELREPAAFYGWVNQITVNQCNALLRKYRGLSRLDDEDEIINLIDDDPANLPDKALDDEATRKIILEVIDNLPDGQRACVILYYYTQNTISQIADMLETNESTVKSRLSLARAKIRAALEYKAEKEGIKLWGIPLALTPILREAFEQFVMPEGAEARIRDFISRATAESMNTGDSHDADTSGRIGPKSGTGSAATSATKTITKAVISMSTKKIITTVVIVLLSAAVVTAGVIFLPPLFSSPDNTTPPGVTDTETPGNTPGATDPTPGNTMEPGNTTEPDPTTPGTTNNEPVVFLPDPPNMSEEYLARIHMGTTINALGGATAVDNMIDEAYEKYGKYLNENISKICVKVGLYVKAVSIDEDASAITPEALNKVNDFLITNGEEPLGTTDPEQRVAALWLAASLYYDPDYHWYYEWDYDPNNEEDFIKGTEMDDYNRTLRFDIAVAFALAKYSDPDNIQTCKSIYLSDYNTLFNIPHHL